MPEPRPIARAWLSYAAAVAIGYSAGFSIVAAAMAYGLGSAWGDIQTGALVVLGVFIGDVLRGPRK